MKFWMNGTVHEDAQGISIADRGFLLGDGLFETLMVRKGRPVFFKEHVDRLAGSAETLGIPLPYDQGTLYKAIEALAAGEAGSDICSARITLTRGEGPRGLVPPPGDETRPVTLVTLAPASAAPPRKLGFIVSSIRRNEGSPASCMKTLNYLDNLLAKQEAARAGADEAVMLNSKGFASCASVANIFVIEKETLLTPALSCGVLPGITRAKVIECAQEAGIRVKETALSEDTLLAHPVFFTNSLMGLVPAEYAKSVSSGPATSEQPLFVELAARYAQKADADIQRGI